MKFFTTALLALATAVLAQRADDANFDFNVVRSPEGDELLETGTTHTIRWDVGEGFEDVLINIILVGGPDQGRQVERLDIASGIENSGSYDWEIPYGIGGLEYNGLIMESVEDPVNDYQWSMAFRIEEGPDAPVSSSSSASVSPSVTTVTSTSVSTVTSTSVSVSSEPSSSSSASSESESSSSSESGTATETTSPTDTDDQAEQSESPTGEPEDDSGAAQVKIGGVAVLGALVALGLML